MSIGKNGAIHKRIAFIETDREEVYELSFGNVNDSDEIEVYAVGNNGDRKKILATIANAIEAYAIKYPDRWVFFTAPPKGQDYTGWQ